MRTAGNSREKAGDAGIGTESSTGTSNQIQTTRSESAGRRADAGAADTSGCTILVAEDEAGVRVVVEEVLRRNGYFVLQAADGVEALDLSARHSGPIHLLLTDISMPRLDGRQLHFRLTNQRPEMRTLLMPGLIEIELHPGSAFLPKPFAPSSLLHKAREVLKLDGGGSNHKKSAK